MKIKQIVIGRDKINVMDYIARLCATNLPVLPLATLSLAAVSKPMRLNKCGMRSVTPLGTRRGRWGCFGNFSNRRNHPIAAAHVLPIWKSADFLCIDMQRVSVTMPHLVVANTHLTSSDRSIAVFASAPYSFPGPSIFRRSMLLNSLVMHQAKSIGSMLSPAAINAAYLIQNWRSHGNPLSLWLPKFYHDKALGNYMHWLGSRIQLVEETLNA